MCLYIHTGNHKTNVIAEPVYDHQYNGHFVIMGNPFSWVSLSLSQWSCALVKKNVGINLDIVIYMGPLVSFDFRSNLSYIHRSVHAKVIDYTYTFLYSTMLMFMFVLHE